MYTLKSLSTEKNPTPLTKKPGVYLYKLTCEDCQSFYIGHTGRSIRQQLEEHIEAYCSWRAPQWLVT